jgi:protein phosphatase
MTDVGLIRDHNEDNFLVADLGTWKRDFPDSTVQEDTLGPHGAVFAVCDGMGGAAAGEVASQMAVDTLFDVLRGESPPRDRDEFARRLVRSVEEAGARIFSAAKMDRSRRGMGTTATVAGLMDRVLFVAQVGDSRAYVLRQGKLGLVTKDQSLVNQLIEAGQLSEDEAEAFEHSNIILQALGTTDEVSVDLTFLELRRGDRLMLCSDGLSGLVHDELMRDVLAEQEDPREACRQLIEMANNGGGHDNVTVVIADFEGEGLAEPDAEVVPSYQQYPLPAFEDDEEESESITRREPSLKVRTAQQKPGADVKPSAVVARAERPFRPWLIAAVLLAVLVGAVVIAVGGPGEASRADESASSQGSAAEAASPTSVDVAAEERPVEVQVRTDVPEVELFVDGQSYGMLGEGEPVFLRLGPAAYHFEAKSGGSVVASANVTVKPGVPADVRLMMPSGRDESAVGLDGGTATEVAEADAQPSAQDGPATEPAAPMPRRRMAPKRPAGAQGSSAGSNTESSAGTAVEPKKDARRQASPSKSGTPSSDDTSTRSGTSSGKPGTGSTPERDRSSVDSSGSGEGSSGGSQPTSSREPAKRAPSRAATNGSSTAEEPPGDGLDAP